MALNIGKEITAMKRMTVADLRRRYAEVFGESTTSRHKQFLVRRVGYLFARQKQRLEAERDSLRQSGKSPEALRQIEGILAGYDRQVAQLADTIDPKSVSIGAGLWYFGLLMRDQFYTREEFSQQKMDEMNGFGIIDLPEVKAVYKARPLAGMWATPPQELAPA